MTLRLDASAPDFEQRFIDLLGMKRESSHDVDTTVRDIIADVVARGDAALIDYSKRFDRIDLAATGIAVSAAEVAAAEAKCSKEQLAALDLAYERITVYHAKQKPADVRYRDAVGVELGWRWSPIDSVGLYVPGGTAAYPSSVLMNVAPARLELVWMKRAAISLPDPAGPVSMTRPLDLVTFSSCDFSALKAGLEPSISDEVTSLRRSSEFSRRRREVSIARETTTINWSILKGFSMKS